MNELNLESFVLPVKFVSGIKKRLVVFDLLIMSKETDLSKVSRDWLEGMVKLAISNTAKTCGTISGIEERFSSGGDALFAKDVFWAKSKVILKPYTESHHKEIQEMTIADLKKLAMET